MEMQKSSRARSLTPRRKMSTDGKIPCVMSTNSSAMMSTCSSADSLPAFGFPRMPRSSSERSYDTSNILAARMGRSCTEEHWQDNTKNCSLCSVKLGKRYFKRRHHCRICGQCVCAPCSQSFIFVTGEKNLQRTCHECVAGIPKVPALKRRMALLADRLQGHASADARFPTENCGNLEQVVAICESAVGSFAQKSKPLESKDVNSSISDITGMYT